MCVEERESLSKDVPSSYCQSLVGQDRTIVIAQTHKFKRNSASLASANSDVEEDTTSLTVGHSEMLVCRRYRVKVFGEVEYAVFYRRRLSVDFQVQYLRFSCSCG